MLSLNPPKGEQPTSLSRALPVMTIHGTGDNVVGYDRLKDDAVFGTGLVNLEAIADRSDESPSAWEGVGAIENVRRASFSSSRPHLGASPAHLPPALQVENREHSAVCGCCSVSLIRAELRLVAYAYLG